MKITHLSFIHFILLFVSIVGVLHPAKGQFQVPDVNMPSPNAASMGLYGEVPVSLYTGTPQINIPLYTLEEGRLQVPISLSYHASGVRVNQHPGWVGLNWNLNAGGAITRTVKDLPDETVRQNKTLGFYFSQARQLIQPILWETGDYLVNIVTEVHSFGLYKEAFDTEPDEFSFNFMGYSGKFYLTEEGKFRVQCDQLVQVELIQYQNDPFILLPESLRFTRDFPNIGSVFSEQETQKTFFGFRITTEEGTQYEFGARSGGEATEFSKPFFSQYTSLWVASTWYLTKISTSEGQQLDFEYEVHDIANGRFTASLVPSIYWDISVAGGSTSFPLFPGISYRIPFSCVTGSTGGILQESGNYGGQIIRNTYLARIVGATTRIHFRASISDELGYKYHVFEKHYTWWLNKMGGSSMDIYPHLFNGTNLPCSDCTSGEQQLMTVVNKMRWRKLDKIEVETLDQDNVKICELTYVSNPNERLRLVGILNSDKNETGCKEAHTFEYYTEPDIVLPDYLDLGDQTDHWGFYNQDFYALESLNTGTAAFSNHKNPSFDLRVRRLGLLRQITYPTGGWVEFEYEPHQASKVVVRSPLNGTFSLTPYSMGVGGVRISKIKTISDQNHLSSKRYDYSVSESPLSSGVLAGLHRYAWPDYQLTLTSTSGEPVVFLRSIFSYQNLLPGSLNSSGTHIGYSQVKEIADDDSYTVYNFTSFWTDHYADPLLHMDIAVPLESRIHAAGAEYDPATDRSFERGKLIRKTSFTAWHQKVDEYRSAYQRINSENEYVRAISAYFHQACNVGSSAVSVYTGYAYRNLTYFFKPSLEEHYTYDQQNPALYSLDRTEYTYNDQGLPIEVKTSRLSDYTRTRNRYVADYYLPDEVATSDPQVQTLRRMKQQGMLAKVVERQVWTREGADATERLTEGLLNFYQDYSTPAQLTAGRSNLQVQRTMRLVSPAPIAPVVPISVVSESPGGAGLVFQYDPRYTRTEVEFPTDATAYTWRGEPTKFRGTDGIWHQLQWGDGPLTGKLLSRSIGPLTTTYEYDNPLVGVSKITDPTGNWRSYTYDGFNRLKEVRDQQGRLLNSYRYFLINSQGCPN